MSSPPSLENTGGILRARRHLLHSRQRKFAPNQTGGRSMVPAKNISYVLERMMHRHMSLIHHVASELLPKKSPELEPVASVHSLCRPEQLKR